MKILLFIKKIKIKNKQKVNPETTNKLLQCNPEIKLRYFKVREL